MARRNPKTGQLLPGPPAQSPPSPPGTPDDDPEALLAAVQTTPADDDLRARAALALTRVGRDADAAEVLNARLVNLTAHAEPPLPCLCKRCFAPAVAAAEAGGMAFHRGFAVAKGRVLYFWAPRELAPQHAAISRAVGRRLGATLAPLARPVP